MSLKGKDCYCTGTPKVFDALSPVDKVLEEEKPLLVQPTIR